MGKSNVIELAGREAGAEVFQRNKVAPEVAELALTAPLSQEQLHSFLDGWSLVEVPWSALLWQG